MDCNSDVYSNYGVDYSPCIEISLGDVVVFKFDSFGTEIEYSIAKECFKNTDVNKFVEMLIRYFCVSTFLHSVVFKSNDAYEKAKSIAFENAKNSTHFICENDKIVPTNWKLPIVE